MNYKERQKQHQINLLSNPRIFIPGTEGYGVFRERPYPHILKNGKRKKNTKRNRRRAVSSSKIMADYFNLM